MDNTFLPVSSSPERNTFQAMSSSKKLEEDPTNENAAQMVEWYDQIRVAEANKVFEPAWRTNNMEYDLRSTDWILEKTRSDETYAQHLYAAMCNRDFTKNDVWPILEEKRWSCSWRHAGGIIADMREEGDYIDWYCSGIVQDLDDDEIQKMTVEQKELWLLAKARVGEGVVTDEIKSDLLKLGWLVIDED